MSIYSTKISIYGIMIILSLLVSLIYMFIRLKREKIQGSFIYLYIILYVTFSITFGKLFTYVVSPNPRGFMFSGLSSYGGFIGVILSAVIFEKIVPTNNTLLKYAFISLPLTYAIGKIGCFCAGCCHGIPYSGFLSVTYVNRDNISVFPIQLMETIVFLIIFLTCNKLRNNKNIIYVTFMLSGIAKFLLDFFRYDHLAKGITINQIVSIVIVLSTIIIYVIKEIVLERRRKGSKNVL